MVLTDRLYRIAALGCEFLPSARMFTLSASFLDLEYKVQPFATLHQIGQSDKILVSFVLTLTNYLFVKEYLIFRQAIMKFIRRFSIKLNQCNSSIFSLAS